MNMGAERISDIVKSLRNFSRLDEAKYKNVDIHQGIESTLVILNNRCKPTANLPNGIQIIRDYGELPLIDCYPGQLNQVLMNIIVNAIDALEENANQNLTLGQKINFLHIFLLALKLQIKIGLSFALLITAKESKKMCSQDYLTLFSQQKKLVKGQD